LTSSLSETFAYLQLPVARLTMDIFIQLEIVSKKRIPMATYYELAAKLVSMAVVPTETKGRFASCCAVSTSLALGAEDPMSRLLVVVLPTVVVDDPTDNPVIVLAVDVCEPNPNRVTSDDEQEMARCDPNPKTAVEPKPIAPVFPDTKPAALLLLLALVPILRVAASKELAGGPGGAKLEGGSFFLGRSTTTSAGFCCDSAPSGIADSSLPIAS
jgi:hypothetical protein